MYIQPTTNIRLLKDVPLDTTYDHTIYFESATAQYNYFIGLQKYNLTNYTYQRVKRGIARVGIKADNLYDCNYMMFQNTAYGNKWFYAFITAVEFVNNECAEIYFELDVMQTWFFDYELEYCFVDREHTTSDTIGEHIEPENLDVGEYVYNGYGKLTQALDPLAVVIMISDETESNDGNLYDGVYGGCTLFAYNLTDTESIKNKLNQYLQKPDAIVGMYMCPVVGIGSIDTGGTQILYSESATTLKISASPITTSDTLDGYTPKNNKLYTYPYNFISVENGNDNAVFRYEFFNDNTPTFDVNVPITMPVQVALRPTNYKGSGNLTLNGETLLLRDYPMCSWSTDSFKAWLAQNALPIFSTARQAGSLLGASIAGAVISPIAVGALSLQVANLMQSGYKASIAADVVRGSTNSGNINVASKKQTFWGGRCSVSKHYARMIDDYFTRFGYSIRRLKLPNRAVRPHWTYTKTIGCTITGSIPSDDEKKICSIYDNGITFWKNGSEVGQYNLDNTV